MTFTWYMRSARYYHVHSMETETEAQRVHYHALVSELVNLELRFKPGDHPNPGIEPRSPALKTDSLLAEPPEKPLDLDFDDVQIYTISLFVLDTPLTSVSRRHRYSA
ncbi:unnamed protein product [Rangifer tarandus platyrhynchus]|uniref:Uncharacterized protein n=1 Tax=Rangifer tarandus platyrhynchus TaxID=3082113 RepID=A0ABN8YDL2_RANTA|nr:unnamed protein product [Rangifer tarandus platyrhynchus]